MSFLRAACLLRSSSLLQCRRPLQCSLGVAHHSTSNGHQQRNNSNDQHKVHNAAIGGISLAAAAAAVYAWNREKDRLANSGSIFKVLAEEEAVDKKPVEATEETKPQSEEAKPEAAAATPTKKEVVPEAASLPEIPITSLNRTVTPDLPTHVQYLLVGAGTASFAAYRAIKARDPKAKILVVGSEDRLPYMRPPLSKEMWYGKKVESTGKDDVKFTQWNGKVRSVFFEPRAFYTSYKELEGMDNGGISLLTGRKVVKVDATKQEVELDNGSKIGYDKCLLATGGKPKSLKVFDRNERLNSKITLFRTIEDFYKLEELTSRVKTMAVIGGGFLGSELACALGNRGRETGLNVIQIFPEKGNMGKVFPEYLQTWTTEKVGQEGVRVIPSVKVEDAMITDSHKLRLFLSSGEKLDVDHAVVAVGLEPNTELASTSRLEIDEKDKGFKVNAELEARSNLYAAGDVASFFDVTLGRRRVEHHDHAVVSGRLAGENMTGAKKAYTHQSMFWSDLGPDIGYEAIGLVDSSLETVAVFAKATEKDTPREAASKSDQAEKSESEDTAAPVPTLTDLLKEEKYGKGVVFYLRDNVVVGIILWNVFGRMGLARKVIKENKTYDDLAELAKLFNIHSD